MMSDDECGDFGNRNEHPMMVLISFVQGFQRKSAITASIPPGRILGDELDVTKVYIFFDKRAICDWLKVYWVTIVESYGTSLEQLAIVAAQLHVAKLSRESSVCDSRIDQTRRRSVKLRGETDRTEAHKNRGTPIPRESRSIFHPQPQ